MQRDPIRDAANQFEGVPDDLVRPTSESELVEIISKNYTRGTPITTHGGLTGLTGGGVPNDGDIAISMENMRTVTKEGATSIDTTSSGKITYHLDQDSGVATFPARILLEDVAQVLGSKGRWYAPNPTCQQAQLGASVATNGSGSRTFGFGATREWVDSVRVVLPSGETLAAKRGDVTAIDGLLEFESEQGTRYQIQVPSYTMPPIKNASGLYATPDMDLVDLFVGSEGILGVVTEIGVKTLPQRDITSGLLFFDSNEKALQFVEAAKKIKVDVKMYQEDPDQLGLGVMSLEYFDEGALKFAKANQPIPEGSKAAIEYEFFAHDDTTEAAIFQFYEQFGAIDGWQGEANIVKVRSSVPKSVNKVIGDAKANYPDIHKVATDFAVPEEHFAKMNAAYKVAIREFTAFCQLQESEGPYTATWGHIGNDHLHLNFIPQTPEQLAEAKRLYAGLVQKAIELGGTVSAEHGVGKKILPDGFPLLQTMYGPKGIREIMAVKESLDPKGLLNAGNMIPRYVERAA